MGNSCIATLAARAAAVAVVVALAGATRWALAQSCGAPGSPGGTFGAGLSAAVFGSDSAALPATLGAWLLADPALRPLLESPASCAPAEPASREPAVPPVAAGNPVDLVSGAKYERAIDLHLPVGSPGVTDPLDFVFARHYSSAVRDASVLGPGWRHSFETRLMVEPGRRGLMPFVLQADGRRVSFARRYRLAGGGARRHAARHDDGVLDEKPGVQEATWVWRWRNGRQLVFDAGGRLVRIVTADRDAVTLRYGDDGRLAVVADNRGHRVDLRYHASDGRAAAVAAGRGVAARADGAFAGRLAALAFPGGREVVYRYDGEGRLERVEHLDGRRVRYHYEDGRAPERLTGVTLPGGARSDYRYDARGRVEFSRAAGASAADALRFAYEEPRGGGASGGTQVSWGDGEQMRAVYRWRIASDGVPMLEAGAGAQCAACPPVGRQFGWAPAGDLASIESGNARLEFVRDAQGRLRSAWLRETPRRSRELLAEVRWHDDPVLDLAALVRRPSVVPGRWHDVAIAWNADGQPVSVDESGYSPSRLDARGGASTVEPERVARGVRLRYVEAGPARGTLAEIAEPLAGASWLLRHDDARRLVPDVPAAVRDGFASAAGRSPGMAATAAAALATGAAQARRAPRTGRLDVVSPAGRVLEYAFDDFDRAAIVRSPDWGTLRRRHDAAGRIVAETLEGAGQAEQRWDAEGRLLEHVVRGPAADAVATRYRHREGRVVAIEHPEQRESFEYDVEGRLVERTIAIRRPREGPLVVRLRYRHDPQTGLLVGRDLSGGASLTYRRDERGQVVALLRAGGARGARTLVAGLVRSGAGLARVRYGNGVEGRFERDPLGIGARVRYSRDGALVRANDPVLADHLLRLDARGDPVLRATPGATHRLLHDRAGRLVQVLREDASRAVAWRYAWDADGTRTLAQEAADPDTDERTRRELPRPGAHGLASERGLADGARRLRHDAAGRVVDDGVRRYRWSPAGQLLEVSGRDAVVARYRYDHRGERIAKEAGGRTTYFVYEGRRLVAELDARGRVEREYVWLADLPVAVLDAAAGRDARVAFLHFDHLGAPVLATDAAARVVWRAEYAPFGRATTRPSPLRLALRLPGQYEDDETGLHYNDHRYYDPDLGRYLSPDPIGLRGGLDPYAYAGGSPARKVDPNGLLLFAFDGTGNADPPPGLDDWSNVYKLARAYADGRVWYMSGVGTDDAASGIHGGRTDAALASSAADRVGWMLAQLDRTAAMPSNRGRLLQVDVIGFSRGAAMARDFANRVAGLARGGHFAALGSCVGLRFLGLWDTVAQFGLDGISNLAWKLAVPPEVAYAAQAVALNEHRTLFPAESILGGPAGGTRIERGFVGAHSDVGGSYAEGDLSDVALVWMREQAIAAGVPMFALSSEFQRVTDPWLHDSNAGGLGDREFRYRNSLGLVAASPLQRVARVDGLDWSGTAQFITRLPSPLADAYGAPTLVGRVDVDSYAQWLRRNYAITVAGP